MNKIYLKEKNGVKELSKRLNGGCWNGCKQFVNNDASTMIFEKKTVAFEEHGQVGTCNLICRASTLLVMVFGASIICDHGADGEKGVYCCLLWSELLTSFLPIGLSKVLEMFDKYALFPISDLAMSSLKTASSLFFFSRLLLAHFDLVI